MVNVQMMVWNVLNVIVQTDSKDLIVPRKVTYIIPYKFMIDTI